MIFILIYPEGKIIKVLIFTLRPNISYVKEFLFRKRKKKQKIDELRKEIVKKVKKMEVLVETEIENLKAQNRGKLKKNFKKNHFEEVNEELGRKNKGS